MEHDGSRRVREIVAVPGRVGAGVIETAEIFPTVDVAALYSPDRAEQIRSLYLSITVESALRRLG